MEVTQLTEHLFVGGDPLFSDDLDADVQLLNHKVNLIIDLRDETDEDGWDTVVDLDTVSCVRVPMDDDGDQSSGAHHFMRVLDMIQKFAGEYEIHPSELGVYVHCHMGINRAPSVALFLMTVFDHTKSPRKHFETIRELRPMAGIAYAWEAVETAATLSRCNLKGFGQFLANYWTKESRLEVNRGIKRRHKVDAMGSQLFVDATGGLHGIARRSK